METKTILIDGEKFEVRQPYAEGHVCSAIEAKQLNQVRAEGVSNNLRSKIKDLLADGKYDEAQVAFAAYDAEYVFSLPGIARPVDPVEREALKLAREWVKERLAQSDIKINGIHPDYASLPEEEAKAKSKERFDIAIGKAALSEPILELARERVASMQRAAASSNIELSV